VGAAALWARSQIRRHRRATVALALLFGVAFGFIGAAIGAERRADGAIGRYAAAGAAYDAVVSTCPPGADPEAFAEDFNRYIEVCLDEAGARRTAAALASMPEVGSATYGEYHVVGILDPRSPNRWGHLALLVASKTRGADFLDGRPIMVRGRDPRPGARDEVVVSETAAKQDGLHVGDRVRVASWPLGHLDDVEKGAAPRTAPVELRVVGVGRFPIDLSAASDVDVSGNQLNGQLYSKAATSGRFADTVGYGNAVAVRLRAGPAGFDAFEQALTQRWSDRFVQIDGYADIDPAGLEQVVDNERRAVLAVAAIALVATIGFAGLTLVRQLAREQHEWATLVALGYRRSDLVAAGALRSAAVAVPAAVLAGLGALTLSPLGPLGLARRADRHLGFHLDPVAVAGAALGAALVVVAIGALVPVVLTRPRAASERHRVHATSVMQRLGPAAGTGAALAGVGWRRVATVVTTVAIAALVAAAVTVQNLDRTVTEPARYGAWWDVALGDYSDPQVLDADAHLVQGRPDVRTVAGIEDLTAAATLDGHRAALVSFKRYRGDPQPVMASGRPPTAPNEIALGRDIMRAVHARVGDTVELAATGSRKRRIRRSMTVTGQVVVDNPIRLEAGAGEPAFVVDAALQSISPVVPQQIAVRFDPTVRRDVAIRRLAAVYRGPIHLVAPQDDLRNLHQLRTAPWAIAGLLALLAFATLVHAIVTMVSVNRRGLALLSVLGAGSAMRSHVTMSAVASIIVGATAIGLPAGVIAGRSLWRSLALGIGLPGDVSMPVLAPIVVAAGAVLIGEAIAWLAARRLTGRNLADELRAA
jgi:hypothetical protein